MNLKRKSEIQERRIASMQERIEKLTNENTALRTKNRELSDKNEQYQQQFDVAEELRQELIQNINEINELKDKYKTVIEEAQQTKKDFTKRYKTLIKQLKSQV